MGRGNEKNLFLLNLFNNGTFSVIAWTPIQAAKGFKVMTAEQAAPYIKLCKMGKNHTDNVKHKDFIKSIKKITEVSGIAGRKLADELENKALDEADDSNTQDIVKNVTKDNKVQTIDGDEVRELSVSQESIQIKESKYIRGLQHKSTLESHMLEKYQCEIPSGRLDAMKALANSMITDLAKESRLYLVDNQVTTN